MTPKAEGGERKRTEAVKLLSLNIKEEATSLGRQAASRSWKSPLDSLLDLPWKYSYLHFRMADTQNHEVVLF